MSECYVKQVSFKKFFPLFPLATARASDSSSQLDYARVISTPIIIIIIIIKSVGVSSELNAGR